MTELTHLSASNVVLSHVYQREVDADGSDSLSKIVARIRHGSSVLDVGTGSGALGRYLQETCGCVVDGVTYNDEEASVARPHYRSMVVLDLEHERLESKLSGHLYDVVVCADVLEHLRNAEAVLKSMSRLLKPGGVVIVSLPNVTHLGVVLGLLAGRFVRTREGLLDSTHVHFLDRIGLQALVDAAGFSVVVEDAVVRNLVDTEFASLNVQALPKVVGDFVSALPDASVFQFVWTLQPKHQTVAVSNTPSNLGLVPQTPVISQVPFFRSQLFLDTGNGFSQELCTDAFGEQTDTPQNLQFKVRDGAKVRAARIDLADRPGQIEFFNLQALDADGHIVWEWGGDWAANLVFHQTDWTGARGWHGGRIVRLTGDDPWVQLPLADAAWEDVCIVKLKITGPQLCGHSDYPGLDARQVHLQINQLTEQVANRVIGLEAQLDSARSLSDFRQTDIDTLRHELRAMTDLANFRQSDIDTLRHELRAAEVRQQHIEACEAKLLDLGERLNELSTQLALVYKSRSWRATKGLRWIANKLSRPNQS